MTCKCCSMQFDYIDNDEEPIKYLYAAPSVLPEDHPFTFSMQQIVENGHVNSTAFLAEFNNAIVFDMHINYCPVCGRFLGGDVL